MRNDFERSKRDDLKAAVHAGSAADMAQVTAALYFPEPVSRAAEGDVGVDSWRDSLMWGRSPMSIGAVSCLSGSLRPFPNSAMDRRMPAGQFLDRGSAALGLPMGRIGCLKARALKGKTQVRVAIPWGRSVSRFELSVAGLLRSAK